MIFGSIAGWLVKLGLSHSIAKKAAPWVFALAAALVLIPTAYTAFKVWDYFDDKAAVKADRLEANNETLKQQLEAEMQAAQERLRNDRTNRETQEAYRDAIINPEPGDDPDPAVRLACERLRRSGQDTSSLPECGRR